MTKATQSAIELAVFDELGQYSELRNAPGWEDGGRYIAARGVADKIYAMTAPTPTEHCIDGELHKWESAQDPDACEMQCARCNNFRPMTAVEVQKSDGSTWVITDSDLEKLGTTADKADNLVAGVVLNLSPQLKIQCLTQGLKDISTRLKEIYRQVSDQNPWEDFPDDAQDDV
jgi:hypothetical protein